MASLLESFEQQYATLSAEITSKTGRVPNLSGPDKNSTIREIEKHLDEAKELLEQMELEARDVAAGDRQKIQNRVKAYQAEQRQMGKELKRAMIAFSDQVRTREELLGPDELTESEDQRQRLLENSERLERASRRLESGYGMVVETEQIGAAVLEDLHSQRETMKRSRDRLRDNGCRSLAGDARILTSMLRRVIQNRLPS
ncbi:PREDICTED: vesicle transport through interaction with t-SNAREs homolog 1A-like [Priapulus caudatus]|uniref:Vesicle transport through interaction with t-SNAREs homolog 1A-like n=1 Tax=Priapulus caudatus TaxID=37621 RepID=A0ABM1F292_PRICU|nr:PREDICTED: vesicle transport through interaction with t-SNAREs homolog 1A-like [Priapulus caudatus]